MSSSGTVSLSLRVGTERVRLCAWGSTPLLLVLLGCLLAASPSFAASIAGSVFEDVNYGGGAGRSFAASSGAVRPGARVELFDGAGAYVTFATTNGGGNYSFPGLGAGNYTVRVVNSSVTSSRPNAVAGLLPVQTFRTNASSGAAVADVNRVGGEDPTKIDAGDGSTTLAALTTATTTAQSVTPVTLGLPAINNVDFGFNFDTIVSTRDSGQGSLREFLTNSNTLGNTGLTQVGQSAGVEASLFMIPDGAVHPGLRAGLTNQLTLGIAEISLASLLPSITDAATRVDGTTQTANVGNTNSAVLGTGGTVGVDALALGQVAGPEVSIRDGAALATGMRIAANNATVRGLGIRGFGAANGEGEIRIDGNFTGALIENNVLGSTALSFVDPGAAERGVCGVHSEGGDSGTIQNNLIGFHNTRGIFAVGGSTGWTIVGNEIRDSGQATDDGDGIAIDASSTNAATGNLIVGSSSQGYVTTAGASGNTFTNNTVTGNGVGTPTTLSQSGAITMRSTAVGTLLDRNVVHLNYGAGIMVNNGASTTRMTRNSLADNGTITARNGAGPTGQVGIDLNSAAENANVGTSPFRTLNDSGDGDTGGNGLLNFPILVSATLSGGNLTLQGFARPGSVIELFTAAADPSGFGEGQTHKITLTEGGTGAGGDDSHADTDAGTGTYGPGAINGVAQGTDTTNQFTFVFPVPSGVIGGTPLTATATLGGETSEFSGNVAVSYSVSGKVFEDVNYGGGAGRSLAASSGAVRSGARVELFDTAGAYVTFLTTDVGGNYSFTGLGAGNYTVRVVNSSVTSSRPSAVAGLLPVQTFRTNASSGAAVADVHRVGGEDPSKIDAADGSTTLAALTTATTTAQSLAPVTLGGADITGVDFGFNFDTIVSTRDTGQGSLREFLTNSSTLGNSGLAQAGQTAGAETSLFMIPDGLVHPGLRAGLTNQLTLGVAEISLASLLPSITDTTTRVDGTTQTANVGNTNAAVLGTGGTVGVDALALGQVAGPEVSIRDGAALATGIRIAANDATVRGLAIRGFGEGDVRIDGNFTGALIEDNVLGSTALSFVDPGAAERGVAGIHSEGGDGGTIRDNLIGFHDIRGIYLLSGSTGWTIVDNEIRDSGQASDDGDGIVINASTTNAATGNLIVGSSSQGYVVTTGASGNTFTNNTVTGNGVGTLTTVLQSAAITVRGTTAGTLLDRNVIQLNHGAGAQVNNGASTARLTRNSFADNGTITARNGAAPTGQIGIDLNAAGDDTNLGTAPFRTLNDDADADAGGNGLLNFPILASATLGGGNLTLQGFARPGSVIELFVAAADPSGFGEGQTHKITLTEGGTGAGGNDSHADTDAGTGTYGPGAINGVAQGTDTTNRFSFVFPVPSGVIGGTPLTATATLGGETSEFSGNVAVGAPSYAVSGTVFEDVNYGGGAGRNLAASSGVVRSGARVELFDTAGAYVTFLTTDVGGNYSFAGLGAGNYTVRVVNSSVTSSRPGAVAGLLPVQTFRTDASTGSAIAVTDRVGGEDPTRVDAGNGSTTLAALTSGAATAQSIAAVAFGVTDVTGVDFGFNFDTVVSTRDAGQGSLRQFVTHSNALGNAGLAQVGQTAGTEASLFMIADGAAHPGLRAGLTNQLTGGVGVISLLTALPAITDGATRIDGTTQTTSVGDTNPGTLGAGGSVGTGADGIAGNGDDAVLSPVDRPEVELRDGNNLPTGLEIAASNAAVRGLALYGFGNGLFNDGFTNIKVGSNGTSHTGTLIERNVIGASATSFTDPGAGTRTDGDNVRVNGGDSGTIRDNLIGFATGSGVGLLYGSDGWTVTGNEIRRQGLGSSLADGVGLESSSGHTIGNNSIVDTRGVGIDMYLSAGATTITGNTVSGNGIAANETPGIRVYGANSAITSNRINSNYGAGVMVVDTASANRISRNSIFANGTILSESGGAASNQLGIDLLAAGNSASAGTAPFVTSNDAGDGDAGGNALLNFPVPAWAVAANGTVTVGFGLDVPAGSYRVEWFTNPSGADPSGHGEGQTLVGAVNVTHPGGGSQNFTHSFPGAVGDVLTATATACTDGAACTTFGSTSEFGTAQTVTTLAVVKRAFRADGTPIASGLVLPRGTPVKFVLYVNNPGTLANDVSLRDVLDPAFAYVAGSLRYASTTPACALPTCTAGEETAIYTAVNAGTVGTDGADGDVVSFAGSTVDAGNQSASNLQLDVPAGRVFALIFTVHMQ